jgi:dipeptidyl aminopeptidase/acylaminoacyl peptidase
MTARYDLDRELFRWLEAERPTVEPSALLDAVLVEVDGTRRRPGWLVADRWTWRHSDRVRVMMRTLVVTAVVGLLVALLASVVLLLGSPRPAPPNGPTTAGLIAFDTAEGIVVQHADATGRRVIVPADGQSISPTWSRDGLHLVYWHRPGTFGSWSLVAINPDGSGRFVITDRVTLKEQEESLNQPSNLSWSPDSRRIAFAGDVDGGSAIFVAVLGQPGVTQITDARLRAIDPAWSPDGSLIAFQSAESETLHVVSPDGSGERQLSPLQYTFLWPEWSPDGMFIATTAWVQGPDGPDDGQSDIFVVPVSGGPAKNVSRDLSPEFSPTWSPDGTRLAWARQPLDGSANAYVVVAKPDGPNVVEIRIDADLAPPTWAPDGTRVYSYIQGSDGKFHEIVVIDPEGIAPTVRLPADGNIGNGNWQRLP